LTQAGYEVELVPITTTGDVQQTDRIGNLGSPGVFTKELQRALLDNRIDLAVHSLKDLPTDEVPGLVLAAVPERESPFDVLVSSQVKSISELPPNARVGTGSLRRRAQLLHQRPDLQMLDIRGNVDTRLRKLAGGDFDAIILAEAGLNRLGLAEHIAAVLDVEVMLPAVGQGALGIETRSDDDATRGAVGKLDHAATHQAVLAERSLLAALLGGCLAPVGALAKFNDAGLLELTAAVLSADGKQRVVASASSAATPVGALELGRSVAAALHEQGAATLIAAAREAG
jgi:hydroxymethylbilane synthase